MYSDQHSIEDIKVSGKIVDRSSVQVGFKLEIDLDLWIFGSDSLTPQDVMRPLYLSDSDLQYPPCILIGKDLRITKHRLRLPWRLFGVMLRSDSGVYDASKVNGRFITHADDRSSAALWRRLHYFGGWRPECGFTTHSLNVVAHVRRSRI